MCIIYNIIILLYSFGIKIASLFNKKAKLWVDGRKDIFENLKNNIDNNSKIAWFHVSSLGEFEQGRPLIESFKNKYPNYKILLTFFSPSGYEVRKNYEFADYVYYLPADTIKNAKKFINIVNPDIVFWVKYDFWFNYLNNLTKRNIPIILISGLFRNDHIFFKFYGSWFKSILTKFNHLFVQNESSAKILKSNNINNYTVAGDNRFDRVLDIVKNAKEFPLIEKFKDNKNILIIGSSWIQDEEIIIPYINSFSGDWKFIIAPHEIKQENIERILNSISKKITKYSIADDKIDNYDVLIIDNIGMLSGIYRYVNLVYVGGGFGKSIHNTQEPAIWGLPIVFGPKYEKFQEAVDMKNLNGAFAVFSKNEALKTIDELINNADLRQKASEINKNYMINKTGATSKVMSWCLKMNILSL